MAWLHIFQFTLFIINYAISILFFRMLATEFSHQRWSIWETIKMTFFPGLGFILVLFLVGIGIPYLLHMGLFVLFAIPVGYILASVSGFYLMRMETRKAFLKKQQNLSINSNTTIQ